jgi:hypothetical protein
MDVFSTVGIRAISQVHSMGAEERSSNAFTIPAFYAKFCVVGSQIQKPVGATYDDGAYKCPVEMQQQSS